MYIFKSKVVPVIKCYATKTYEGVLYVYGIWNGDTTSPDYTGLGNDEIERMWKEVVVTYYKILSRNLHGGAGENHKKSQSGKPGVSANI
jgi:hypothetical protein